MTKMIDSALNLSNPILCFSLSTNASHAADGVVTSNTKSHPFIVLFRVSKLIVQNLLLPKSFQFISDWQFLVSMQDISDLKPG